ncbi:MAG: proline racemase family protein [Tissierellia bacterium]|nr:proline racemase family protein [Tissierellia bacterium]MDD4780893.1 proline racemase family protein [Tissierellia bacterium]
MNIKKLIQTYDTHMNNVESRIITGGVPYLPGKNINEKLNYLRNDLDEIRKFIFQKPRGKCNLSGLLLTEPTSANSQIAAIFMDGEGYENCYIEDLVGAFTVICETGMVNINYDKGEKTEVLLETQFGLFKGIIDMEQESAKSICIVPENSNKLMYKDTKKIVEKDNYAKLKAFITGMHMFMLDSEDTL